VLPEQFRYVFALAVLCNNIKLVVLGKVVLEQKQVFAVIPLNLFQSLDLLLKKFHPQLILFCSIYYLYSNGFICLLG